MSKLVLRSEPQFACLYYEAGNPSCLLLTGAEKAKATVCKRLGTLSGTGVPEASI